MRDANVDGRLRKMCNLHTVHSDPFQKMFNTLCSGTYIRPHRHYRSQKNELLLAIIGGFNVILFTDEGEVSEVITCQAGELNGACGVEIPYDRWHTVYPLGEFCIIFEGKAGPFLESEAKDYASWSPEETSKEAEKYLANLMKTI